ncbi:MAG TPA: glycosyltransferase [Saprospiraceae bacterium]|nr:glycosyltransferase [Saprospiraceae bacterium]
MFTHFLITRFNLPLSGFGPEIIYSPSLDETWLRVRLKYFLQYCVPSVLSQSTTAFTWLIYLDRSTPEEFRQTLQFSTAQPVPIELVYVKDFDGMLEDLRHRIRQVTTSHVITSRIDNDDVIHMKFMETVQIHFTPASMTLVNFNSGYEYHVHERIIKKWNERLHNQFMSLFEDAQAANILTIYGFPHWQPPGNATFINISSPPGWAHIRHENNYSPDTYKAIPVFTSGALKTISPVFRDTTFSFYNTMTYALRWFPRMIARRIRTLFVGKN